MTFGADGDGLTFATFLPQSRSPRRWLLVSPHDRAVVRRQADPSLVSSSMASEGKSPPLVASSSNKAFSTLRLQRPPLSHVLPHPFTNHRAGNRVYQLGFFDLRRPARRSLWSLTRSRLAIVPVKRNGLLQRTGQLRNRKVRSIRALKGHGMHWRDIGRL